MTLFVKLVARFLGIALLVLGVAGFFVSGGVFGVRTEPIHNLLHIGTGVLLLAVAGTYGYARSILLLLGIAYGAVAVIGFAMNGNIFGVFQTNMEGNLLSLVIAAVCLFTAMNSKSRV